MKRKGILAGLAAAALLCGLWCCSGRALTTSAAVVPSAASPTAIAPPSAPVARSPVIAPAAAPSSPPPRLTSVGVAKQYAEAVCRCPDMECVEKLREERNQTSAAAIPERDPQGMHDAFVRASKCVHDLGGVGG